MKSIQHPFQVLAGRQHKDFIAGLNARHTVAADKAVGLIRKTAVDGHNAQAQLRVVQTQISNAHAYGRRPQARTHRRQARPSTGELAHLQRIGVFNQLADIAGQRGFGANDGIHRKAFRPHQGLVDVKPGGAHPRHAGGNAKHHVRNLAAHQIGLILRGTGNQQIGVGSPCLRQHLHIDAVAHHAAQVKALLQLRQALRIGVDDRDVIALRDQALRHAVAHTARTQNNDLHALSLVLSRMQKKRQPRPPLHCVPMA